MTTNRRRSRVSGALAGIVASLIITGSLVLMAARAGEPILELSEHAAPTPTPAPRQITVAASGDMLIHTRVSNAARTPDGYDFTPQLANVKDLISAADLAVCHLEVPLARDHRGLSGYPMFNAPPEVATALRVAGYDACTTASNHAVDKRTAGVISTADALDEAGIAFAGTARTPDERGPRLIDVDGVRVALLSHTYGTNGIPVPEPWMVNPIDEELIVSDAAAARDQGADIVIVSLHWGAEYVTAPTTRQRELGRRLLASDDIDLVWGHHAHVVQPIERIDGEYLVYGMGNFLSGQTGRDITQDGVLLLFTFAERGERFRVVDLEAIPTWVEPLTYRVFVAAGPGPAGRESEMRASHERTLRTLGIGSEPAA